MVNLSFRACLHLFAATLFFAPLRPATPTSNLSTQDMTVIDELCHLWSAKADNIWPGASKIPVRLIYIKADSEYAIGFAPNVEGFTTLISPASFQHSIQARKRTFATDLSASFSIGQTPAVVIGSPELLKQDPAQWVITASHEMFHVFQATNGSYTKTASLEIGSRSDPSWQLSFPFPYQNAEVMRLIHLQGYSLWLAATSNDVTDIAYNIGTALDAVAVYKSYLQLMAANQKNYQYSEFQEWNEGVAAYTEYRFAEAAGTGSYQPTAGFIKLPDFHGYDQLWEQTYQARIFLVKHAGRAAQNRNAFYHLGMGKALALDQTDFHWKEQYFKSGTWLDDLLKTATEAKN